MAKSLAVLLCGEQKLILLQLWSTLLTPSSESRAKVLFLPLRKLSMQGMGWF